MRNRWTTKYTYTFLGGAMMVLGQHSSQSLSLDFPILNLHYRRETFQTSESTPISHSIRQHNILHKNSHADRLYDTSPKYHTTLEHRLNPYRTLSTLNISRLTIPHLYCLTPASKPGHTVQTRPLKHRVHFLHRYLSIENLSKLSAFLF